MKLMRFMKAKSKAMYMAWSNPKQRYKLSEEQIENNLEKKDLEVLVD